MSDADAADHGTETMRERAGGSTAKLWLLIEADRWFVTMLVLGVFFVTLVGASLVAPVSLRRAALASDPLQTLFQALLTAIITGVTLVVTITQLVISQELGAVGDQRERMEGSMTFRSDVADVLDVPASPPDPASFLRALIQSTEARAGELGSAVGASQDGTVRRRVAAFTDDLEADADMVAGRLAGAQFGTFDVLFAALDYNYSYKLYEGRRLRAEHGDAFSDDARRALDEVIEALRLFGPAREHIKTLYFQWELMTLSRAVLYAAVPSLLVAVSGVLFLDVPGTVTGATLGVDNIVWVVSAATAVSLAPFALLFAYILRIATVAQRTLAIGPFVLRETHRSESIDWDDAE
jgi:hypothetical protein